MAAQAKKQIGQLFRKNLLDLVKGLRSHKGSESEYINECLSDIKSEVASIDKETKAAAISKLTYLYMMGYDIAFAHFNVVEVMSQPSFGHRRIAYLAASLSFRVDTDVILLTVHLFKKRFSCLANSSTSSDGSMYESGCAINCLANICTPYLAETLLEDIYTMMNSSKPYLRKKSVLVLYSIFRKFPKALRLTFDRLKDKLRDEDGGVQNAAVNVICELARKNPSNYLSLLPHLFDLLNNSNNNWMLIKLVKLLGSLIPAEARLGRKLQEPLTHIITNTPAKSLLYECINTVTAQSMMQRSMVRLCLDKLRGFVEDQDQNLKYLGLLGLNKIMDKNKRAVAQHKDLILQCLDDSDITIRMRALDLITSMVNEKNLEVIIQRLTDHLYGTDGSYRDHVLEQIVNVCRRSDYEFVRDFAWYVQLLCTMTGLSSMCLSNALLISSQMMDVTIRVPEVREFSVSQMEELMIDNDYEAPRTGECISHILSASAYIVGEYSEFVCDHLTLVSAMLQSRITSLPQSIQCIFIHNAFKVVATAPFSKDLIARTIQLLEPLATSHFIEVQERANTYLFFMKWFATQESDGCSLAYLFESELMPLHPNSQKVIADKIPNGLDLDEWMFDEAPPYDSDSFDLDASLSNIEDQDPNDWYPSANDDEDKKPTGKKRKKKHTKQLEKEQKIERQNRQVGPFYIGNDDDIDDIDIEVKHMDDPLHIEVDPKRKHKKLPKQKKGKKYTVLSKAKKKHTAESTNNISNKRGENDALSQNIDLSKPIDAKEMEQYTIKPYKQDEIVYKEEEKKHTQKNKKHSKKEQKKKGKKHKKKHKKEKKNEDDLLGFLDTNATQNNDQKRTTNEVHLLEEVLNGINGDHKVKKKKKKKKKKILFANDNVCVSYCAHSSLKRDGSKYLDLVFSTKCHHTKTKKKKKKKKVKSIKLTSLCSAGNSDQFEIGKSSFSLGKKKELRSGESVETAIGIKCVSYDGDDRLSCQIVIDEEEEEESLVIELATHCFVVCSSPSPQLKEDDFNELIAGSQLRYSVSQRLKLPQRVSCADCLDILVRIWKLNNISMTDKKATYGAPLMLNQYLAVIVKTNQIKNAIQITAHTQHSQHFVDKMIDEFKSIVLNLN